MSNEHVHPIMRAALAPFAPLPRRAWPFMSAAEVKRTALVKVLSEDEAANEPEADPGIATREWPVPQEPQP